MPVGTARMAALCLPGTRVHVGIRWDGTDALTEATSDPARPAVLLWPGEGARDVLAEPPEGPVTLVVVDGTWPQARRVVRDNPALAALPRFAFRPPAPSCYRIRKEPRPECVSTIEAISLVLGALERDPARFGAMLLPMRTMVDRHLERQAERLRAGFGGPRFHGGAGGAASA
jgi:tRNA-uridine aminocarboxypropyltransferase